MVKFGRVSRARPHGRRVLARPPFGPRKHGSRGVCLCAVLGCRFGCRGGRFGTPDGRFLGTFEAVLGHAEAVSAPSLHEKMHVLVCTLLESFRPPPWAQVGHKVGASRLLYPGTQTLWAIVLSLRICSHAEVALACSDWNSSNMVVSQNKGTPI